MNCIQIKLEDKPSLHWLAAMPDAKDSALSSAFPDEDSIIFYDWLDDDSGLPCGFELHLFADHPFLEVLKGKAYITFDSYPRILLRRSPSITPRHLEAFGDIFLFQSAPNSGSIVIGLDTWLNENDRLFLSKYVSEQGQLS